MLSLGHMGWAMVWEGSSESPMADDNGACCPSPELVATVAEAGPVGSSALNPDQQGVEAQRSGSSGSLGQPGTRER